MSSSVKSMNVLVLQHVQLTSQELSSCIVTMRQLHSLDLSYSANVDDHLLEQLSDYCHSLKRVSLRYCTKVTEKGIQALLKMPQLECLDFSGCIEVRCRCLAKCKTNLKWLRLEMLGLTASDLSLLANSDSAVNSLEVLSLEYNFNLNDEDIIRNIPKFDKLRQLNLAKCKQVTEDPVLKLRDLKQNLTVYY